METLTYNEVKAVRAAERMIRDFCGVGFEPEDYDHYPGKKNRVIKFSRKAQEICEILRTIGESTQSRIPGGDT